jgi:hypothetical protein
MSNILLRSFVCVILAASATIGRAELHPAAAHARQLKAKKVDLEDQPMVNPEDSAEASSFISP